MSFCDDPDKAIRKKTRKRLRPARPGRNSGSRHRGKPIMATDALEWLILQPEDGVIHPPPTSIRETGNQSDEMWDTVGFIQNWYNPCVREKFYAGGSDQLADIVDAEGVIVDFNYKYPSCRGLLRANLPFLSPEQLDELHLRAEQKLSKVVSMNMSIINFILELIEVLEGNIRILKRFDTLYKKCMAAYRVAYERYIKLGRSEIASRWLAWNFAIKPFLSDLQALVCSATAANKKMAWLRDNNHKQVILDYSSDLTHWLDYTQYEWLGADELVTVLHADPEGCDATGPYQKQITFLEVDLKFVAHSRILLDIPDKYLDGAMGMGILWSVMQGISNPVGVIWEAIPFSWLIDYFLSYRARLFQTIFDINPYNNGVHVLEYGHSYRCKAKAVVRSINTETGYLLGGGPVDYELYVRKSGLPESEQSTLFKDPWSWYHASIVAAVAEGFLTTILGNRRRRKRRHTK